MATLRIFTRNAIAGICRLQLVGDTWKNAFPLVGQIRQNTIKVATGQQSEKEIELPDFEVTRNPAEWSYVEWALRQKVIPPAPTQVQTYPSGWKPQSPDAKKLPYFIERTKNHMVPVYLSRSQRGIRRVTIIRRVQGDIMLLEKELKSYLEKTLNKSIGSQINEPAGLVKFRGDNVNLCRKFLLDKGF